MTQALEKPLASDSLVTLRRKFRAWVSAHESLLEPYKHEVPGDIHETHAYFKGLQELLWDNDWVRLGWDPKVGGIGGSPKQRLAIYEELTSCGYYVPLAMDSVEIIAPLLVKYGEDYAINHLSKGYRGDEYWCQGFSEPEAGSDLGSLRTRAVQDGDGWRLSGQKMWSSNGHVSSYSCLMARTGEPGSGYKGLTMFWIDLNQPGVRLVPTKCASGRSETSEIFLDDAFVPNDRVMGGVGGGWAAVMFLMQFERAAYAWFRQADMHLQLNSLARGIGNNPDDIQAEIFGDIYCSVLALRARARETAERLSDGVEVGPEGSIDKLLLGATEQALSNGALRLLGSRFELGDDDESHEWRRHWSYSRITTIYGGAAEVQRDLIGERLLGLPRGR